MSKLNSRRDDDWNRSNIQIFPNEKILQLSINQNLGEYSLPLCCLLFEFSNFNLSFHDSTLAEMMAKNLSQTFCPSKEENILLADKREEIFVYFPQRKKMKIEFFHFFQFLLPFSNANWLIFCMFHSQKEKKKGREKMKLLNNQNWINFFDEQKKKRTNFFEIKLKQVVRYHFEEKKNTFFCCIFLSAQRMLSL